MMVQQEPCQVFVKSLKSGGKSLVQILLLHIATPLWSQIHAGNPNLSESCSWVIIAFLSQAVKPQILNDARFKIEYKCSF
jgi:hypothetical protein